MRDVIVDFGSGIDHFIRHGTEKQKRIHNLAYRFIGEKTKIFTHGKSLMFCSQKYSVKDICFEENEN